MAQTTGPATILRTAACAQLVAELVSCIDAWERPGMWLIDLLFSLPL
jgi:hypothetical protein